MSIILKVETPNGVRWKTDSFWSLTETREHAKIHGTEGLQTLYANFLYLLNDNITDKRINYYDGCKVGYDLVEKKNIIQFEFLKNRPYSYKIVYNKENNKFNLIDISRKKKLEKIKKFVDETNR